MGFAAIILASYTMRPWMNWKLLPRCWCYRASCIHVLARLNAYINERRQGRTKEIDRRWNLLAHGRQGGCRGQASCYGCVPKDKDWATEPSSVMSCTVVVEGGCWRREASLGGGGAAQRRRCQGSPQERWRKYALEAIIKLIFISLFHDKCLLFMLELY